MLPLLMRRSLGVVTTHAAVLVSRAACATACAARPALAARCCCEGEGSKRSPHLLSASGRLLRLERGSVCGRRLEGARSLRVAAWRQNCSVTLGAPRSRCGRSAWCTSCARGLLASMSAICAAIFWKCSSTGG